jgi:hypothetical protein
MREQHVAASEFLEIRNIRRALVRDVQYDAERSALFVSLDGEADNLRTGSRGLSNDFRSNALSRLKNKQPMILLLLFTAWLVSTSIGVVTLARRWGGELACSHSHIGETRNELSIFGISQMAVSSPNSRCLSASLIGSRIRRHPRGCGQGNLAR